MEEIKKGYKKTKIGVIPEDWEVKRLGEVIIGKFTNGYSPVSPQNETSKWVLTLSALTNGKINLNEKKPAPIYDEKLKKFKIQKGDFLISRSNTPDRVGFSGLVDKDVTNYYYPDLMIKFRVNQEIIKPYYLEYFLKSSQIIKYFRLSASGTSSSMVKINQKIIEKTPIVIPSLKEQEKIAKILSIWDRAIEIQEELIKEKEKLKTALMQKLLSGEVRFKEFSEEWEEVKLGNALKEINKTPINNSEYEIVSVKLYCKGLEKSNKQPKLSKKGRPYFIVKEGEILIGKQNFHNGSIAIVSKEYNNMVASNAIFHLIEKKESVDKRFIYYYLTQPNYYKKVDILIGGTGQKEISKKEFFNLKIKLPPLKEQQKISKVLSTADKEIELLKKELKELKNQKKALMQKLLTGKVRVKVL